MYSVPPEASEILSKLDCTFVHQSIRELDPGELPGNITDDNPV